MNKSIFEKLDSINVNEYTEKKGQFTYLSWSWAVRELLKVSPDATWEIHQFGYDGVSCQPYMQTEAGCFVQVTVTVNGIDRTQVHPVLDNRNQTIEKPNAFQKISKHFLFPSMKLLCFHQFLIHIQYYLTYQFQSQK